MTPPVLKALLRQCYRAENTGGCFQLLTGTSTYYCFIIFSEKYYQVGENTGGGLKLCQLVCSSLCMTYKILVATTLLQYIFLENFYIN